MSQIVFLRFLKALTGVALVAAAVITWVLVP